MVASTDALMAARIHRFRLGVFDPPSRLPWPDLGPADVGSDANAELALEAAQKGALGLCRRASVYTDGLG